MTDEQRHEDAPTDLHGYSLDQLRADALTVRRFLVEERTQREVMQEKYPSRATYWWGRIDKAIEAIEAQRRVANYVACTAPHSRLPAQAKQMSIFEEVTQ